MPKNPGFGGASRLAEKLVAQGSFERARLQPRRKAWKAMQGDA
jgi:hypothetical protein